MKLVACNELKPPNGSASGAFTGKPLAIGSRNSTICTCKELFEDLERGTSELKLANHVPGALLLYPGGHPLAHHLTISRDPLNLKLTSMAKGALESRAEEATSIHPPYKKKHRKTLKNRPDGTTSCATPLEFEATTYPKAMLCCAR